MYLGIDLGTTNSAVAGNINSEIRLFKTSDGADVLPSVIYIDKRGHRLFGQRAYAQVLLSPENVATGFKRLMGTSTKIEFAASGQVLTPEECTAEILRQLVGQATIESGGREITGTVITIPAAFNQMQSEATIRAARIVGLEKVALLQEPITASMAAMAQTKNKSGQFLVYDLGGGTFDLALVQSLSGSVNILAHEGINMLGGRDFDRVIVNSVVRPWLIEKFNLPGDFQKNPKYRRVVRMAQLAAEKAKIALSMTQSEMIFASDDEVRITDESGVEIYLEIELTRSKLEELVSDHIKQTIELSRKILKDNGYTHEDIDRIVFIGGPTKMPAIRDMVPDELAVPADLETDPMTAVAQGAAIYCESREWLGPATKRKVSRDSAQPGGKIDFKYDFPARTCDDKARIRVKVGDQAVAGSFEIQIDTQTGWTSGRKTIDGDLAIEVPVENMGDNSFELTVFDACSGRAIPDALTKLVITKTHASAAGIPATQTICVKVREELESTRNVLEPLIGKGTLLPASGSKSFRAAKDLEAGEDAQLDFELYQDEGVPEPELNLCVGVFRVSGDDLPEGMKIRAGDELVFHWLMSDSGLLTATVELTSVGQSFDTPKFYVDQAGHQAFDLSEGSRIAEAVLENAEEELQEAEQAIGVSISTEAKRLQERIQSQRQTLDLAQDSDTIRAVTEGARHIRQDIGRLRLAPENRAKILECSLSSLKAEFNQLCRQNTDQTTSDKFDQHARNAQQAIARGDERGLREAEMHINEMEDIHYVQLWQDPKYVVGLFEAFNETRHLASDKKKFDVHLKKGRKAIEEDDVDELRRVILEMFQNRMTIGTTDEPMAKLASIMRA